MLDLIFLCPSNADNLAANFSRELADYIIYIIDVSAGDKIPRKGGPGITQADLLVCVELPFAYMPKLVYVLILLRTCNCRS